MYSKEKKKQHSIKKGFWGHRSLSIFISFLGGAFILSLFSIIQKTVVDEGGLILDPRSYIMPVSYGGVTGIIFGLWYIRLKENEAELLEAYSSTLEGWAKAVEMRDKNTQNHTNRVVALTEELVRSMKIKETDLAHIKRGAMLHDIGKIDIPDSILNKPGELTEEERVIMEEHPARASDMLMNIRFLHPALPIPYYHHERWDGSGYPDALTNDRPYRKAWTKNDALLYIKEKAGTFFDPYVVKAFSAHIRSTF